MLSSKIELLLRYNELLNSSSKASPTFPDDLCEFLISEYELQAAVLFKMVENNNLIVLGKSKSAKKIYIKNSSFKCDTCRASNSPLETITFNTQSDCLIPVSDFVIYEGCLSIIISNSEKVLLKIAKKNPFTKLDKDDFEAVGSVLANLINIWQGLKSDSSSSANISVEDVLVNIAHELRTPTNSIMGFASLLNENNLSSTQAEYVSTLKESAFNLLSLINDLIDFAKVNKGLIKDNLTNISIRSLLEDLIKIFVEKIDRNKVEFIVNIDKSIPANIKFDAQKLRFILLNIIAFSLNLTEQGKISITVSSGPNRLNFRITDSGNGISANRLKTLFNPFSFGDLSNLKIANVTGLGLQLSKRYIELLKGKIDVISNIGRGSSFSFYISAEMQSPIEEQISALPKPGIKNKVLVVEDDYAASKLLNNYLTKWGYVPTVVNSAQQALHIIEKEQFLAVLMDIVLPDANGFELLKQIREHKNTKNTPVIVCSVEAEQQKAFLMGAVEYFVKPIKYKYLVEVLTSYRLKKDSDILIVDDDIPTLNLMKQAVEQAGYNAIAEAKSARVMNLIEHTHLDLAIVDLDMPEVNGFELIKMIKTKPEFARLPIIIYTGKENYQGDLKKIDGMFEELLHKSSSNIEDLADTINKMINRYDEPAKVEDVIKLSNTIKILLVEDYKHSQIIVTRLLKKNSFESVVVVENGAEAVEQVQKQKFDLILMDMQMPIMNGFEATEKIRQMPQYADVPIIALTAFAMKGDREKCMDAGATDYIPKPIDSQEFIDKVKFYTENKSKILL